MWIKVNKAGDVWPAPRRMVSLTEGEKSVTRAVGDAAIAAGLAEEIEAPSRPDPASAPSGAAQGEKKGK